MAMQSKLLHGVFTDSRYFVLIIPQCLIKTFKIKDLFHTYADSSYLTLCIKRELVYTGILFYNKRMHRTLFEIIQLINDFLLFALKQSLRASNFKFHLSNVISQKVF